MTTSFVSAPDGTRIAYDQVGAGPAIVLLHGGGGYRQEWHDVGYVQRLQNDFRVITMDLRGHGESSKPVDPGAYTTDHMEQDILSVADACGVKRFILWGMSFGGKIGRYLAVHSERVEKLVLMGTPMGPGVSVELRQAVYDFCEHWPPILPALDNGTLTIDSLSQDDQDTLSRLDVPVVMAWAQAMLEWPAVEPADFGCPTLWLIGSEDQPAMASFDDYRKQLDGSSVQAIIFDGLDHEGVIEEIDRVFPTLLAFSNA